jgi:predicted hydrocarbon binding protein
MDRKTFITSLAMFGMCGCGGAVALAQSNEPESPDVRDLKRRVSFMQKRMARLIAALDEPTRQKVLETMGRECAKEFGGLLERFKGKPEEFLEEGRKQWMERAAYDKAAGTITVVDRSKTCTCAFVDPGVTPPDFCACTLGWQKEAYSMILGEPVDAELESSVLRGAGQCAFRIKLKKAN